MGKGKKSEKW